MASRAVWLLLAAVAALGLTTAASAATTTVVTAATPSWTQDDTRPGGIVQWTTTFGAPAGLGSGSLELATDGTTAAKAGLYTHTMGGTPLSDVTGLSYWTYQAAASSPSGDASYQLQIDVGDGAFTTLVYEPYWNGTPAPASWQEWDVGAGLFWSSHTTPDLGNGNLVAGAGGPPLYTLAQVETMYPNATVLGIGVNVGTFNPSYDIGVDGVTFNDTTYDFEPGVCSTSTSGTTITLLADCTETTPFVVPDGFTLDGAGHTLTAADPSATQAFVGAAVRNGGAQMYVENLHVVGASNVLDCNTFTGIDFVDGGGSVESTTIDNMLRGGYTGCQNGLGIHALDNGVTPVSLVVDGNQVTRYNKNGITIDGSAITATVRNNTVTGAGPLGSGYAAQNGIQIGYGASAVVSGNTVSGNWYTPKSDVACGLLFYQASGVKQQGNNLFDNEVDLCNAGRGGGKVTP